MSTFPGLLPKNVAFAGLSSTIPTSDVKQFSRAERFRSKMSQQASGMRRLPGFLGPGEYDVICARGKRALGHPGNRRFRAMIEDNLEKYSKANSKLEKSLIVSEIVDAVRESSPYGGFIREEGGVWYEVGDHIAREKCGQRYVRVGKPAAPTIVLPCTGTEDSWEGDLMGFLPVCYFWCHCHAEPVF